MLNIDINKCYGCSACSIICPVGAIEMEVNEDGFYRPVLDKNTCINCKLCDKVCILNDKINNYTNNLSEKGFFSIYSTDNNTRTTSTSGGVAYELSRYAINKEYAVCGCVYNAEKRQAEHIVKFGKNTDVSCFKGSKYIQSKNESGMKEILNYDKGIVIGLPCQIAGFRSLLETLKKQENFILVDLICHCIPSYNLFNKYIDYIDNKYNTGKKPTVEFRCKDISWRKLYIRITNKETGEKYISKENNDIFLSSFLNNSCCSNSCFECNFRKKSCADIRIGDYWGKRYKKNDDGYSMVCSNTEKGLNFLKETDNLYIEQMPKKEYNVQCIENAIKPDYYDFTIQELKKENPNLIKIKKFGKKNLYWILSDFIKSILDDDTVEKIKLIKKKILNR